MNRENNGESERILTIPTEKLSPGMRQYQDAKRQNPDCLIMLRMGDFYEMFYEDAVTASKELDITLTARGKSEKRAPLAGVPYHALETYLGRLVKKGYKVAIIEQLEDPKNAKGLVKRGLVRIVTPGTVIETSMLQEKENNYILAITCKDEDFAIAVCDISTGEFSTTTLYGIASVIDEIARVQPRECLVPESLRVNIELITKITATGCFCNSIEDHYFKPEKAQQTLMNHFSLSSLDSFGIQEKKMNISVSGALMQYLIDTQKNTLSHIKRVSLRSNQNTMLLDASTFRNLELIKNMKDGTTNGTLLSVLDKTITSMGGRQIKKWLKAPLVQESRIQKRLDAVDELTQNMILREELCEILKHINDLERLIGRINYGTATPRDLISLRYSLQAIPSIKKKLELCSSELLNVIHTMPAMHDIVDVIQRSIRDDAPVTIRDGGIIKSEYNFELAQLHTIKRNSKQYLQQIEENERRKTGINTLRIGYNKVFGYYIEITRKNTHFVPDTYIRKQTTANAERYVTEELKQEEEKILGAQDKIAEVEYALFKDVLTQIAEKTIEIQHTARKVAVLDVICSFATTAAQNGYVKPVLKNNGIIQCIKSRHPVVERIEQQFIANDITLNPGEMMIITGPNMAGKSTVQRQIALLVLMAQIGSFVPAESASISIVDRIFTRVGAHDDLSSGQSTFMVEMNETASILNNATENSLLILDEIGRGTSTFDGVSIAWSVAEHIHNIIKAKTLFSTHYHVMNKLAEKFVKIKNYNLAAKESRGEVLFLYKLVEGSTDQSYGVHVAKLAGLPFEVIERAKEIQLILEKDDDMMRKIKAKKLQEQTSLEGFSD
ncbi:DNA mismatch repair protein MutS [Candidatus Woesearchaeota archaeon CG10_big_fil_rev_8_21_14_0_10_36_11]|nr:MAG: DNA mismatch repair protein MutS [Candidatus Woesearchaeota archaeon CG10_big_fil_rev_8_21_14_0_10_36_11]